VPSSARLLTISARRHPGRCQGVQSQMREVQLYHGCIQYGGNDLELAAAVRAPRLIPMECCESARHECRLMANPTFQPTKLADHFRSIVVAQVRAANTLNWLEVSARCRREQSLARPRR